MHTFVDNLDSTLLAKYCTKDNHILNSFFSLMMDKEDKATNLLAFDDFFKNTYNYLEKMYKDIQGKVALMGPLLIKIEEVLVASRSRKADRLSSYYHHWERKLFDAVGNYLT